MLTWCVLAVNSAAFSRCWAASADLSSVFTYIVMLQVKDWLLHGQSSKRQDSPFSVSLSTYVPSEVIEVRKNQRTHWISHRICGFFIKGHSSLRCFTFNYLGCFHLHPDGGIQSSIYPPLKVTSQDVRTNHQSGHTDKSPVKKCGLVTSQDESMVWSRHQSKHVD